jgi:hypothetical protein
MPLFRPRRVAPEDDPRRALYVHLASDGAAFIVRGETGEQLWTDREGLRRELERTRELGGRVMYSREASDRDPPAEVEETFREILEFRLPIQLLEQPHPQRSSRRTSAGRSSAIRLRTPPARSDQSGSGARFATKA